MNERANGGEPTEPGLDDASGGLPEPGAVYVLFEPDLVRVVLTGEIDAELGPKLTEAAEEVLRAGLAIEVDVKHVTFMDSTGVAFLARLGSRSPARVTLLHPPPVVQFLLDVTSIAGLLTIRGDEEPDGGPTEPDPTPA